MTLEQQREYVDAVDNLRRIQMTAHRPPNAFEVKALAEAAAKVDRLTALYRVPDAPASSLHENVPG